MASPFAALSTKKKLSSKRYTTDGSKLRYLKQVLAAFLGVEGGCSRAIYIRMLDEFVSFSVCEDFVRKESTAICKVLTVSYEVFWG